MDSIVKDRMECPICGYSMKILEETETEYKGYCASCSTDVIVKKLNNAITPYKKAIERLREQNYDLLCSNAEISKENDELKSENLKLFNALKSMCDVDICQVCKHNELLVFESMMYPTEYDTRCKKGFHDPDGKYYGIEVHECDCFEVREEW